MACNLNTEMSILHCFINTVCSLGWLQKGTEIAYLKTGSFVSLRDKRLGDVKETK